MNRAASTSTAAQSTLCGASMERRASPPGPTETRWDCGVIPVFPAIALKALKLLSGTDTSLLELCNLIRADLAFSTAVLRIANSPLVAFSRDVTSVLQASMLLGFQRLRSMVITVGLKTYLKDSFTPLMISCWRHSLACAILSERSAKMTMTMDSLDNDFAYTAGLLHDIGRVALITVMPDSYARVIECGANTPLDVLQNERNFCGIDHCDAGRSLMTAWNLPPAFIEIAAAHHDPERLLPETLSLISISCALADSLGFAVVPCQVGPSYAEILARFPDPAQLQFPATAKELARDIANEISALESA
jgi:putative nucleotidyltransferase with HDIG domain